MSSKHRVASSNLALGSKRKVMEMTIKNKSLPIRGPQNNFVLDLVWKIRLNVSYS